MVGVLVASRTPHRTPQWVGFRQKERLGRRVFPRQDDESLTAEVRTAIADENPPLVNHDQSAPLALWANWRAIG